VLWSCFDFPNLPPPPFFFLFCVSSYRAGFSGTRLIGLSYRLCWLVNNTCDGLEQLQPLYYSQGQDFCKRMQAALDNPDFLEDGGQREEYIAAVKQGEMQTLQKLYEPRQSAKNKLASTHEKLRGFAEELEARRANFQDTGKAVHGSALQEVEQEREVAFEVETVRQVKKPFHYAPLMFPCLHPDIEAFVRTGRLPAASDGVKPIFVSLSKTRVGKKFSIQKREGEDKLFVSTQFDRTVRLSDDLGGDNFLRPVNWLLWSTLREVGVVIIPEEAEIVISMLRHQQASGHQTPTHLLTYAAPVTRKMLHFNDLDFFSIPPLDWKAPPWLRVELGIYAGRLYFDWDEYTPLCDFLGLDEATICEEEERDGEDQQEAEGTSPLAPHHSNHHHPSVAAENASTKRTKLTTRPLTFLQEWLAIRRRGQDFVHTPMGFLTQGKPLHGSHPFFKPTQPQPSAAAVQPLSLPSRRTGDHDDDGDRAAGEDDDYDLPALDADQECGECDGGSVDGVDASALGDLADGDT
jgi:hypothetical protein